MGVFKVDLVVEPPTDSAFLELFTDKKVPRQLHEMHHPSNGKLSRQQQKDQALNDKVTVQIGFLRTHLSQYHMLPAGNEAYLGSRKNALSKAIESCDAIAAAIVVRLRESSLEGAQDAKRYATEYKKISSIINSTREACDGKFNALQRLEQFEANHNLTELVGALRGKLSPDGRELRGITGGHLVEYFDPFHHSTMAEAGGQGHFNVWAKTVIDARAANEPEPSSFPVYMEKYLQQPYGTNVQYSMGDVLVKYDGSGDDSEMVTEVDAGFLRQWKFVRGVLENALLNTGDNYGFVVDQNERLFVFFHKRGEFHHSSPAAGAAVICAGMIQVAGGKVHGLSDKSGHYAPTPRHVLTALRILKDRDVLAPGCTVEMSFGPGQPLFDVERLLACADGGWNEDLFRAALKSCDARADMAEVLRSLSDPTWESEYVAGNESLRETQMDLLVYNRPRMIRDVTHFRQRGRRNAMRPSQARELQPLQSLMPLVPRGGKTTEPQPDTSAVQAPASSALGASPAPDARRRGYAVRGGRPPLG